ncbi:MAG TPA: hypothetical protein VFE13_02760, partial [Caulobacteraceae bacterium]|nr:hypothetical protein [Caulobacteraceae bacterium]
MRRLILAAAAAALLAHPAYAETPPKTSDVVDSSYVTADGAKNLRLSAVIEAPVAVLWKAFV